MNPLQRVAVALDTDDWSTYRRWIGLFGPRVGVLKVGLEAFVRWGPEAVRLAAGSGAQVFLDLKLHDIPNTVAGAVRSAADLGVSFLTVHAAGGPAMLAAAQEATAGRLRLLAVTLLTHLDEEALAVLDLPGPGIDRARAWARLAADAGLTGAVCSPQETTALRAALPPPFLIVNPGIRGAEDAVGDQRRTASPRAALAAGADLLVIGRPLTRAGDPERALEALAAAIAA